MEYSADRFFGGSGLPSPLAELIDTAADLGEAIARLYPDAHWLLGPLVNFSPDQAEEFSFFQLSLARPGSTAAERNTFEGQVYFWQQYIQMLDAVLQGSSQAAELEASLHIHRWRSG